MGARHITFKDHELLDRLNIYASQRKGGMLAPSFTNAYPYLIVMTC
jgi:hypothetical protein